MKRLLMSAALPLLLSASSQADDNFSVTLPECTATLERRDSEPEVVLAKSDCPLSLASLAQLLKSGLSGLFPDHRLPIRGIYLGRLMGYPAWSKTLATAAARSPQWNGNRGRPRNTGESDNHRVQSLLNGPAYPDELRAVFASYRLSACVADVEKVLVFKAKEIFPKTEMSATLSPEMRLPIDAQIWLKLQPMPRDCHTQ